MHRRFCTSTRLPRLITSANLNKRLRAYLGKLERCFSLKKKDFTKEQDRIICRLCCEDKDHFKEYCIDCNPSRNSCFTNWTLRCILTEVLLSFYTYYLFLSKAFRNVNDAENIRATRIPKKIQWLERATKYKELHVYQRKYNDSKIVNKLHVA